MTKTKCSPTIESHIRHSKTRKHKLNPHRCQSLYALMRNYRRLVKEGELADADADEVRKVSERWVTWAFQLADRGQVR